MGSSSSHENREFHYGGPTNFAYTEKIAVFEKKNGLLFRLVNTETKQWAFYSDSKKFEFHITVTFGPECRNLEALGNTFLTENPEGGWIAKTIVYPCQTEPFVQGDIADFQSVVNAVLLTTEYKERHKEEQQAAKKAAKNNEKENRDELGSSAQ